MKSPALFGRASKKVNANFLGVARVMIRLKISCFLYIVWIISHLTNQSLGSVFSVTRPRLHVHPTGRMWNSVQFACKKTSLTRSQLFFFSRWSSQASEEIVNLAIRPLGACTPPSVSAARHHPCLGWIRCSGHEPDRVVGSIGGYSRKLSTERYSGHASYFPRSRGEPFIYFYSHHGRRLGGFRGVCVGVCTETVPVTAWWGIFLVFAIHFPARFLVVYVEVYSIRVVSLFSGLL